MSLGRPVGAEQRRALVIDDDTVSRLVLAHMLRRLGFEVLEADDIGPGTVLAVTQQIAVVFCDFWLPAGNGLELLDVLVQTASRPRFVLVTGTLEHGEVPHEGGAVADAYLTKPVGTRGLTECVEKLFGTQQPA